MPKCLKFYSQDQAARRVKGYWEIFFRLLHIHDVQSKCVFSLFDNFKHIYYFFPEFTAHTVYLCMHYVVYYKHAYVANFGYDFWSLNRRDFNPLKHEFLKPQVKPFEWLQGVLQSAFQPFSLKSRPQWILTQILHGAITSLLQTKQD